MSVAVRSDLMDRVTKGGTLLDSLTPGWDEEIDVPMLNIESDHDCTLGQIFGSFRRGVWEIEKATGSALDTVANGFSKSPGCSFDELTRAWRVFISRRRCFLKAA